MTELMRWGFEIGVSRAAHWLLQIEYAELKKGKGAGWACGCVPKTSYCLPAQPLFHQGKRPLLSLLRGASSE